MTRLEMVCRCLGYDGNSFLVKKRHFQNNLLATAVNPNANLLYHLCAQAKVGVGVSQPPLELLAIHRNWIAGQRFGYIAYMTIL